MSEKLNLTDQQYLDLMKHVRADLNSIDKIFAEDSTETGFKHTVSNVGLCTGVISKSGTWYKAKFLTRETALWPKEFDKIGKVEYENPQMFTRKYVGNDHRCPFDKREDGGGCGCFYVCRLFRPKRGQPLKMQKIKDLYDKQIKIWEEKLKGGVE